MTSPRLLIEDKGSGKHLAQNTLVYVLTEDEDGNEVKTEISSLVRRVTCDIKVGEPLTAKLEVYIAGFKTRAQAEEILADYIGKPSFWRRLRRRFTDVTTFNPTGVREYY